MANGDKFRVVPPPVIGLYASSPRSGKSTTADMIEEELEARGLLVGSCPFADPVKLAAAAVLEQMGLSDADASHYVFEDKDRPIPEFGKLTGRKLLAIIGNDIGRAHRSDVWVRRNEALQGKYCPYVWLIDDVRMVNEYESILERGGIMIRVVNDHVPQVSSSTEGNLDGHKFHYTIRNNGTLSALRSEVVKMLEGWSVPHE